MKVWAAWSALVISMVGAASWAWANGAPMWLRIVCTIAALWCIVLCPALHPRAIRNWGPNDLVDVRPDLASELRLLKLRSKREQRLVLRIAKQMQGRLSLESKVSAISNFVGKPYSFGEGLVAITESEILIVSELASEKVKQVSIPRSQSNDFTIEDGLGGLSLLVIREESGVTKGGKVELIMPSLLARRVRSAAAQD